MDALKLATALEKFASYIDENEGARKRDDRSQSAMRVEKIAEQQRALLGDGFTDEMHKKLASLDDTALTLLEKLAAASAPPASLGGAASGTSPFTSGGRIDPMAEFTQTYSGPAR